MGTVFLTVKVAEILCDHLLWYRENFDTLLCRLKVLLLLMGILFFIFAVTLSL